MKNKYLLHVLFIFTLLACKKDSTNNSTSTGNIQVYSELNVDGKQYGAAETLNSSDFNELLPDWIAANDESSTDIFLNYKSPSDGNIYSGLTLSSSPKMKSGLNTNCYLNLAGSTTIGGDVNVTITKYGTKENDIWEGTFSGNVTVIYSSTLVRKDNVPCTGKFRVIAKWY
jgi:hypothetical protein